MIAMLLLRSAMTIAQSEYSVSDSGVTHHILLQEKDIPLIDGSKSTSGEQPYFMNQKLRLPGPNTSKSSYVFIETKRNTLKSEAAKSPGDIFHSFAEKHIFPGGSTRMDFSITGVHKDNLGITHVRLFQQYKGIEIYGSESVFHIDDEKERLTGTVHELPDNPPEVPALSGEQAAQTAIDHLKAQGRYRELTFSEKKFLRYEKPSAKLNYYKLPSGEYRLSWIVSVRPNFVEEWIYFIDAGDGTILLHYNNTKYDGPTRGNGRDLNYIMRTFNVYEANGIFYLYDVSQKMFNPSTGEGIIITLDANGTSTVNLDYNYVTSVDNTWNQSAAISAHYNAAKVYQYYDTTFNRNSINGQGGNIISIVNIANDDGTPMENAFWNGQAVFYGNGGEHLKPLAGALDVTAHELSHGVISTSVNLEYYGQAGAIHEAYADIFACMVDRDDWTIGESITQNGYSPSGAIRDLSDPHNKGSKSDHFWQPIHTTEMYLGTSDNAGIHLNSGIINHAFYNYAIIVGKNKAEKVFYRALTEYLTKTAGFIELRVAVVQSARDLYGDQSDAYYEAALAFESVGIYEEEYIDKTPLYPVNPGEQQLLSYDTSPSDPVTLYLSSSYGTNYRPLTSTTMRGRASVTDDGSKTVFVSIERRIRMINTDEGNVNERIISDFNYYDNVAISKDGKRIAATRGIYDATIIVFDLVSGEARRFKLYNPTTKHETVDAGGVLKAFSVDFDITGEYLIYDAFNVINSSSIEGIFYWDIGIIRVWDNDSSFFGNGKITKILSALPAHVNVTNPVFSKNSPHIIAFDHFYDDGVIKKYSVYTANLLTGKTGLITTNDRLGYPSFSTDDKRLAFSGINSSNMQVIKAVKLSADKMKPVGEASVLVPDAKWPVFFTRGKRVLGLAPVSDFTTDFKYGNYPVTSRLMDMSANDPVSWHWKFEGGEPSESFEQNPVVVFKTPGFYNVTLITTNEFGTDTLIRDRYIHAINPTPVSNQEILPHVYPNPVKDELHINLEGDFDVRIFTIHGKQVLTSKNSPVISIPWLDPGIYLLEIHHSGNTFRLKFVKQ